jgi:hypothetical protein
MFGDNLYKMCARKFANYLNLNIFVINHKIKIKPSDLPLSEIERLYLFC